jgi:hypothetical protein
MSNVRENACEAPAASCLPKSIRRRSYVVRFAWTATRGLPAVLAILKFVVPGWTARNARSK